MCRCCWQVIVRFQQPWPAIRRKPVVAVGYEDGAVLLIRIEDEAEILLKNAAKAPVSALLWKQDGSQLAIGCEDGTGRVIRFATPS